MNILEDMMSKRMAVRVTLLIALLAVMCVLSGCGKLENKGPVPSNSPPVVSLANVPINDSEWLRNPEMHWYATDRDGYVTKYRYSVMREENVSDPEAYVDLSQKNGYQGWTTLTVETGVSSTSGVIRLFAHEDPDSFVSQYFFIEAEDNFGAQSNVEYRRLKRSNHPPETYVDMSQGPYITGSCCEEFAYNLGVPVQWHGEDTLDYPGRQPDFEYKWCVYGPFTGEWDQEGDSIISIDTMGIVWGDYVIYCSSSDDSTNIWTMDQNEMLVDLFRDVPSVGETVWGLFIFEVSSRDDAFVLDPTPAMAGFMALQPECEKDLLFVDLNKYSTFGPGSLYNGCPCREFAGKLTEEVYYPHYRSIFAEAGYPIGENDIFRADTTSMFPPDMDYYARYEMVVVSADDAFYAAVAGSERKWLQFAESYLRMGGKLMIISQDPFIGDYNQTRPSYMQYFSMGSVPTRYFNIQGQWVANFTYGWYQKLKGRWSESGEEFVEGLTLVDDLPDVHVNPERLTHYGDPSHIIWQGNQPYHYYQNAVPGVCFFVSGGLAEGLYMARSVYGKDGSLDGGICGYRYETTCIKTAVFGFPLYVLEYDDAVGMIRGMMNWFDN